MYHQGEGIPQDYKAAMKWFTASAKQGIARSQHTLGLMHLEGLGVPQDYKTAVKWFTLAAEQGFASAQLNLSVMLAEGAGVTKDDLYAHMWANIARSNGHKNGDKLIELLVKQMTPSQIEKAQDLARECVKKNYKGC